MTWLFALPSKLYGYLIGAGVVVAALFAAYLKIHRDGAESERRKQAAREWEAMSEAQKIDEYVAGNSPEDNRSALKKWAPKSGGRS